MSFDRPMALIKLNNWESISTEDCVELIEDYESLAAQVDLQRKNIVEMLRREKIRDAEADKRDASQREIIAELQARNRQLDEWHDNQYDTIGKYTAKVDKLTIDNENLTADRDDLLKQRLDLCNESEDKDRAILHLTQKLVAYDRTITSYQGNVSHGTEADGLKEELEGERRAVESYRRQVNSLSKALKGRDTQIERQEATIIHIQNQLNDLGEPELRRANKHLEGEYQKLNIKCEQKIGELFRCEHNSADKDQKISHLEKSIQRWENAADDWESIIIVEGECRQEAEKTRDRQANQLSELKYQYDGLRADYEMEHKGWLELQEKYDKLKEDAAALRYKPHSPVLRDQLDRIENDVIYLRRAEEKIVARYEK